MIDFELQRCTRKCAISGRELLPGEAFYSALVPAGAEVIRQDFATEAWREPPENAIGWWKSEVPDANAKKVNWAPNEVLLNYFEQLEQQDDKADVRYILALLLVRRRLLTLDDSVTEDDGREYLVVSSSKEMEVRVAVETPSNDRVHEIQEELAQLLYADA